MSVHSDRAATRRSDEWRVRFRRIQLQDGAGVKDILFIEQHPWQPLPEARQLVTVAGQIFLCLSNFRRAISDSWRVPSLCIQASLGVSTSRERCVTGARFAWRRFLSAGLCAFQDDFSCFQQRFEIGEDPRPAPGHGLNEL